jgi:hypothetical protein
MRGESDSNLCGCAYLVPVLFHTSLGALRKGLSLRNWSAIVFLMLGFDGFDESVLLQSRSSCCLHLSSVSV